MSLPGVGFVMRLVIFFPLLLGIMLIGATGYNYGTEIAYNATNASSGGMDGAEDGFGRDVAVDGENAIMKFTAVGIIGLVLAIIGWLIYGTLQQDTRQRVRRPPL